MDESRIPVLVGVGQINDRPDADAPGLDSLALMEAALRRADDDGGGGWLGRLDALSVVAQLSFPGLGDCAPPLAERVGAAPRLCRQSRYPMGDSPVAFLSEAANRIAGGETEIEAVAGGEALRTAARRAAAKPDVVRQAAARAAKPLRERHGLVAPTDVYPLYENACRAAWGQTLAEAQAESAAIWSRFSEVAAQSEGAWIKTPMNPAQILEPGPHNRAIAFPYTKLMVANASVNQGAAFIVASLAKAKAMGVPESRLVYVGAGAGARECGEILARDRFDRSPSMIASLRGALERNRLEAEALDHVELYSCFPCVPKMARRAIGWPVEKPMSVFGGLTFGGGPIGNYMSHAVAAMVETLRGQGRCGLLFGNGGWVTTSHSVVLARDPALALKAPCDVDVNAAAAALRGPEPLVIEAYEGAAVIETYTVFYGRGGAPRFGAIIARTLAGERLLARADGDDGALIAFLTDGGAEPIGARGRVAMGEDGLARWRLV